jgi:hypothetical protein
LVFVWVPDELGNEAGEEVCCCFAAGYDEEGAVHDDFVVFEIVLFALLEDVPDEIAVVRVLFGAKTAHNLFFAANQVSTAEGLLCSGYAIDEESLEKSTWFSKASCSLFEYSNFDRFEDESNPVVEFFFFEASKWFSKREISNDVEGCEVAKFCELESMRIII